MVSASPKAGDGSYLLEDSKLRLGQAFFLAYLPKHLAENWHCEICFYGLIVGISPQSLEFLQLPEEVLLSIPAEELPSLIEQGEILFEPLTRDEAAYATFNEQIQQIVKATESLSELLLSEPDLLLEWKTSIFFGNLRVLRALKTKEWLLKADWFDPKEQTDINWTLLSEALAQAVGF